jgi:hypothetical protein
MSTKEFICRLILVTWPIWGLLLIAIYAWQK